LAYNAGIGCSHVPGRASCSAEERYEEAAGRNASSVARSTSAYPELMAELDAIKRQRIGGLMLRRDWSERAPWPTPDDVDLTHMARKVKEVKRAKDSRYV
jgi:hypothetical protein